nr:hypothetical protein [Pseudomonas fluorescens]
MIDIGQIGEGVAAKANGALVIDAMALPGQGKFYGLSGTGEQASNVENMVATKQTYQLRVAVHCRLQDVDLFVLGEMLNTFGDIASLNGLESLQDFLVVITELQLSLRYRSKHWLLIMPINVAP